QARARVVAEDGLGLTSQSHEPRLVRVVQRALDPEIDEVRSLCKSLPRQEPGQGEAYELFDVAAGLDAQKVPDEQAPVAVDARRPAMQRQGGNAAGLPESQLRGDHAAHGRAADVRRGQAQAV